MTLSIAGLDFPNTDGGNRRSEAMMTLPGDPVTLMTEPRNRHDRNAVAIVAASGMKLGYVSAERAPYIGGRIHRGEEVVAIFQGMHGGGAYIRVRFGGGQPTLPPAAAPSYSSTRDETDGFYPDEEGPVWGA
ncbi:HIRAN domain-containing protein [Sphingomonas sp. Leaf339]|uniref:HIRAN domain-containing protein n=1 Tax=Sphingomonas sp. Leaf339 TaxID=1736343 RepID=UPI001F2AD2BA|nr:HIRAN domain-containing protein [Sphingomonas sp. Leaf339]